MVLTHCSLLINNELKPVGWEIKSTTIHFKKESSELPPQAEKREQRLEQELELLIY